jgi:hypothetical protein
MFFVVYSILSWGFGAVIVTNNLKQSKYNLSAFISNNA